MTENITCGCPGAWLTISTEVSKSQVIEIAEISVVLINAAKTVQIESKKERAPPTWDCVFRSRNKSDSNTFCLPIFFFLVKAGRGGNVVLWYPSRLLLCTKNKKKRERERERTRVRVVLQSGVNVFGRTGPWRVLHRGSDRATRHPAMIWCNNS